MIDNKKMTNGALLAALLALSASFAGIDAAPKDKSVHKHAIGAKSTRRESPTKTTRKKENITLGQAKERAAGQKMTRGGGKSKRKRIFKRRKRSAGTRATTGHAGKGPIKNTGTAKKHVRTKRKITQGTHDKTPHTSNKQTKRSGGVKRTERTQKRGIRHNKIAKERTTTTIKK